ncbi:hypothetical protein [Streptomyces sp. NBC_00286]|uniref:hypothetical protein n=1 Tax=Streptomyces sp. NBC_00286 TaxID=2975701 RepID=UPI003245B698
MGAPDLRGANQSLVFSSAAAPEPEDGAGSGDLGAPEEALGPGSAATEAGLAEPAEPADPFAPFVLFEPLSDFSASATGVRTTTGGMGLDPGMLIRIRVVSVVSVLTSSGRSPAERPASAPSSEPVGVPYGGVPDG